LAHQTPQARFELAANLPEIAGNQFAQADGNALPPKPESPPDAIGEHRNRQRRQPVKKHHRPVRDVAEGFTRWRHKSKRLTASGCGSAYLRSSWTSSGTIW